MLTIEPIESTGQIWRRHSQGLLEFLSRHRNSGHSLIARWGEEILLEASSNQKMWNSISSWEQWMRKRALESCQKWELQTSLTGHVISLEFRAAASVHGAIIHCADNTERSCGSPATGGTYTQRNYSESQTRAQTDVLEMLYCCGKPRGCRKRQKWQNANRRICKQQSANHSSHISTETSFSN